MHHSALYLPADYFSSRHGGDNFRILAEAFIAPTPSGIAADTDSWRKRPSDASASCLSGSYRANFLHQSGVASGAETDVVRKDGSTVEIAVAVHSVHSINDGNAEPCLSHLRLQVIH